MSRFCCKIYILLLLLLLFNAHVKSSKEILIKAFIDTDIESNNLEKIQTIIFYMTKDFNLESKQIIGLNNSTNVDILQTNLKNIGYDIKITLEITQIQVTFEEFINDIPKAIDCNSYIVGIKREIENQLHMETSIQLEIIEFDGNTKYYSIDVKSSNPDDLNSGIIIDNGPIIDLPKNKKSGENSLIKHFLMIGLLLYGIILCCIVCYCWIFKKKCFGNKQEFMTLNHHEIDNLTDDEGTDNDDDIMSDDELSDNKQLTSENTELTTKQE